MEKTLKELNFLILMSYFNRPLLVKNALNSILKSDQLYKRWSLVFCDDGSIVPGKPIVEEILQDHLDKIEFIETKSTCEDKINQGIQIGMYGNEAMRSSNSDVVIMLSDDDELVPDYLLKLNEFYNNHPEVLYSYCKVHLYNPLLHKSKDINNVVGRYNSWSTPINPSGKLDASQVSWRMSCVKDHGVSFFESTKMDDDKPWLHNTDKSIFDSLFSKLGECFPNDIVGQFKGIHDYQLLWNKNRGNKELIEYHAFCEKNAGILF